MGVCDACEVIKEIDIIDAVLNNSTVFNEVMGVIWWGTGGRGHVPKPLSVGDKISDGGP